MEKPASKAKGPKSYQVPAVKRAFTILDSLNESSTGLTVQEISRIHKVPYSTAFYLLETMEGCGYVSRDDESKRYTVGSKLLAFRESGAARHSLNLRALALPLMEELTQVSGLTCHLATLEKDEAVYIEKTEPAGFIRLNTWVGKRNSLHCTAVGKALLLGCGAAELEKVFEAVGMPRRTDRTITDCKLLAEDLGASLKRGYAIDDAEDEPEGRCVAAPVYGDQGKIVASIGLSGTSGQIDLPRRDALGKLVKNYARQISARLGHAESGGAPK